MNIDSTAIQTFLSLVETQSFTLTAKRVGRTQSAVSQQIAKLEALLSKPLFKRGKALSLTKDGEIFLQYARQIFSLQSEALDYFKQPELQGEVHFGLPEDFASMFLSDVLTEFFHIHPRVLLHIECDLTLNLFERFKRKEFDLVLVKMPCTKELPFGQKVWSERLEWVGNSTLINESGSLPLVLSPTPCVNRRSAIEALENVGRKWRLVFSSPSYAGVLAAVKAGMGITVLPRNFIPPGFHILKHPSLPELKETHASLLKKSNDNLVVNSFEEFVLKRLKP